MSERKELLNMLRVMWRKGDSPLRRIYSSWEELESNTEIMLYKNEPKEVSARKSCPYCGALQKIVKPIDELFPYGDCESCKQTFHINNNLSVRKLTEEEKENMPAEWVRILEDLKNKKLAIVFKLD
ncbi:MAG: hypothetical protein NWE95_12860 [Candidatus Bathyarchaeota archaeon]|nr:hypothetical protein [Candidatus Bathyarchaeota archaeon]